MKLIARIWFTHKKVSEDLYLINEPFYYERSRVNIWLLLGAKYNLVIDTGLGLSSLINYIKQNIDNSRPIKAIATDIHFDHTGGIFEFEECFIHESEKNALATGDQSHILSTENYGYITDDEFEQIPFENFSVENYKVKCVPQVKAVSDGEKIKVGERILTVKHLPGHSRGAIILFDNTTREMFCGDVVYEGILLDDLPGSDVSQYKKSLERIIEFDPVVIYPGHFESFDKSRMIEMVESYLSSKNKY